MKNDRYEGMDHSDIEQENYAQRQSNSRQCARDEIMAADVCNMETVPQSTREIVNELKNEAKLDQWRTDSIPLEGYERKYIPSEEDYRKWAEQELSKINWSTEDQHKSMIYDILGPGSITHITNEGCRRIGLYTAEYWEMKEKLKGEMYNSLEEILKDANKMILSIYPQAMATDPMIVKLQNTISQGKFIADGTRE